MVLLNKDYIILRDGNENLISQPVPIEYLPKQNGEYVEIKIRPMTRTEFKLMVNNVDANGSTSRNSDINLIVTHCVEPKFVESDFDNMSESSVLAIVYAILAVSIGKTQTQIKDIIESANIQKLSSTIDEEIQKN